MYLQKRQEKRKRQHVGLVRTPNARYQKLDGTAFAECTSSCDDAVLGSLAMLVVFKE